MHDFPRAHQPRQGRGQDAAEGDAAGDHRQCRVEGHMLVHPFHELHDGSVGEVRNRGVDQLLGRDLHVQGGTDPGGGPVQQRQPLTGGGGLHDGLLPVGDVHQQSAQARPRAHRLGEREETHRQDPVLVRVAPGAHAHQRPGDGPAVRGDGTQHPLVLSPVRGDHDLGEPSPQVVPDGEPVDVGEGLVEVEVAQVFVEHDQADGTGLEEGVEEGEVGLDPVQLVAPARQDHDDRMLGDAGHREDPEPAAEDRTVPMPGGQATTPVALGPASLGHTGAGVRTVPGSGGEEESTGLREGLRGPVAEKILRTRPPVADPVLVIETEYGNGHMLQQRPGLGPERTSSLPDARPI